MFNEDEEWSDGEDAQAAVATALRDSLTKKNNTKSKFKAVGKKSLLRTLQTLESVPEWKHEDNIQDSDSDTTVSPNKKKRRKKRRKHALTSGEQQENAEEPVKEGRPAVKKMKKNRKYEATKAASAMEAKIENVTDCVQLDVNRPQNSDKLSRQQWKNKMKNKRKCKNKYRYDKPDDGANKNTDQTELKKEVKMDSHSNSSNLESRQATTQRKKRKEIKQQRRENSEKQLIIKEHGTRSNIQISLCETLALQSKDKNNALNVEIMDGEKQISFNKVKFELFKEQNLQRGKLRKILESQGAEQHESPTVPRDDSLQSEEKVATPSKDSSFRSRMEQRLESARFRYINEVLYSTSSNEAKRMFRQDPQAFWIYHKGYTAQVQRWPSNPVDIIIADIKKQSSSLVVADFGCGDCKIARSVKNKVHSFDLGATCELVTVCDMAHVPLKDSSVDIAVFCLSLMGTNLIDFVAEANRVLKMGGVLKVAEVASRFDNLRNFITTLSRLGFKMESKNTDNTHFYSFKFVKMGNVLGSAKKLGLQLKPCLYKKR